MQHKELMHMQHITGSTMNPKHDSQVTVLGIRLPIKITFEFLQIRTQLISITFMGKVLKDTRVSISFYDSHTTQVHGTKSFFEA
jgi:hypothetical protein